MAVSASRQRRQDEAKGRLTAAPDPAEVKALAEVVNALTLAFPRLNADAQTVGVVAISAWIVSRSRQAAGIRLTENLVFDLKDAQLRGFAEAALPQLGHALADLPADVPFWELDKAQVVDVVVASVQAANAAAVAAGESSLFVFDDSIPFGD